MRGNMCQHTRAHAHSPTLSPTGVHSPTHVPTLVHTHTHTLQPTQESLRTQTGGKDLFAIPPSAAACAATGSHIAEGRAPRAQGGRAWSPRGWWHPHMGAGILPGTRGSPGPHAGKKHLQILTWGGAWTLGQQLTSRVPGEDPASVVALRMWGTSVQVGKHWRAFLCLRQLRPEEGCSQFKMTPASLISQHEIQMT